MTWSEARSSLLRGTTFRLVTCGCLAFLVLAAAVLVGAPTAHANPYADKIAFIRDGDVWIADADGANAESLTSSSADDECPMWSASHKLVYFVRHSGSTWRVARVSASTKKVTYTYYRDPDTGKSRKRRISALALRSDGRILYFADQREGDSGETVRIVGVNLSTHSASRKYRHTDYEQIIHTVSVSPKGKQLAFTITGGDTGTYCLLTLKTKRTTHPIGQSIVGACWAPSGGRLAFSTYNESPDHVFTASSKGDASVDVPGATGTACAFSNAGDRILFQSGADLYTIALDGSDMQYVTSCSPAFDEPADW